MDLPRDLASLRNTVRGTDPVITRKCLLEVGGQVRTSSRTPQRTKPTPYLARRHTHFSPLRVRPRTHYNSPAAMVPQGGVLSSSSGQLRYRDQHALRREWRHRALICSHRDCCQRRRISFPPSSGSSSRSLTDNRASEKIQGRENAVHVCLAGVDRGLAGALRLQRLGGGSLVPRTHGERHVGRVEERGR